MSSDIEIPAVLTLAAGLLGLPETRIIDVIPIAGGEFVELVDRAAPVLGWLAASVEDVRPGMTAALRASDRVSDGEVLIALLSSHGDPAVVTANLAGPIAIGPGGAARQLVLEDPAYELRARLGRLAPTPSANG